MIDRSRRAGAATCSLRSSVASGFTLLELMIVVTILGIIASVGVPQYVSALRTARIGKAKHELGTLSRAIDAYAANNGGCWPLTLYQVGFGGRRDPWGVPYCYLNYADGTGDGLDWAVAAGLVDPSAFQPSTGGGAPPSSSGPAGGGMVVKRAGMLPDFAPPQNPAVVAAIPPTSVAFAKARALTMVNKLSRDISVAEVDSLVTTIASSNTFSVFVGVPTETTRRRDRYMFPLNTDYDLFSLGPDRSTTVSLGSSAGLDDVIRANNGGYFGPASDY